MVIEKYNRLYLGFPILLKSTDLPYMRDTAFVIYLCILFFSFFENGMKQPVCPSPSYLGVKPCDSTT